MSTKHNIYGSLFVSNNISGDTLNLSSIIEDNSLTQLLVRDNSSGIINYRDVNSVISAATSADTFVTGFTYDDSNNLTISRNDGVDLSASINTMTGLTVNGNIVQTGTTSTFSNGNYLQIGTGFANTGQLTFNANHDGGVGTNTYTPVFAGNPDAGMTVIKMPTGGEGGLDFYVKNHGVTSGSQNLNTFTKILELNQDGNSTFGGNILLPDGGVGGPYIGIGDAEDLKIFHNGNHSIIRETGTGSLYLQSDNNVILSKDSGTELMVRGIADGAVELYYDNVKKIETISDGVDVSGDIVIGNGKFKYTTTGDGGSQLVLAKTQYSVQNNTVLSSVGSINLFLDSLTADTSGDVAFRIFNDTDPDGTVTESNNIFKIADSGDVTITGGITGNTLTLSQTPTLNNSGTDILIRNSSTGEVEYRPVSGITTTDNFVSGGTYNNGTSEINFVGNSAETTFDVDLSSLISSVSGDTFVVSGNADVATSQLTFTYNTGGTFTVTNSAALFSDNDINVTGGTYDNNTGCVTFTTNSGTSFDVCGFVTGLTDTFTTGSTLVGETIQFDSNILGPNYYNVSLSPVLSGKTDNSTFNSYTSNTETILNSKVSGATNLSTTGLFAQKNGDNLEFKGLTSTGGTVTITNDSTTVNLEVVGGTDTNSFSTGGTVTQSATSGDSEVIVQIVGNSGFTPYNITGLTDTFINDFSISSNTFTISQNDGSSFVATADTIDLASVLSAVTFDIGTSGSISATTFNGGTFNGTFVGDGSGLTGITDNDTFVTGTTFASNQITLTRNDNVDVFSLSGGSNVTLSETATNDILIDVSLPPSMNTFVTGGTYNESTDIITLTRNDAVTVDITGITDTFTTGSTYDNGTELATFTKNDGTIYTLDLSTIDVNDTFVTGFTYNDANTITISRNDGVDLSTSINIMTGLTVNGDITVTGTSNLNVVTATTIDFDINYTGSSAEGRLSWNGDDGTLDLGMGGGNVTQQIGQEIYYRVKNQSGATISNGRVIRNAGAVGASGRILGEYMIADGTYPFAKTLGIATEDIANGDDGFVTEFGVVRGIDTTGSLYGESWSDGDVLYVSPTIPGGLTAVEPNAPNQVLEMGVVLNADINGSIFVDRHLSTKLGDISDVQTTGATNGDLIIYNSATTVWEYSKVLTGDYDVNGTLSATTIDGSTILSGGTNLTTIIESLDTYVTGGTVSVPATDNTNSGTIGLFYKNSDGTPRTLPFEDTYTTGSTYDNGTALATFNRNDGTSYTLDLSTIDVNDTFVTGTTFSSNQATVTRNDGTDVLLLTGGTNVTLSNPSTNQIKIDVNVTSSLNITTVSTTTYTATTSDEIIGVDTSSNAVTITLPDSLSSGTLRYEIKDIGFNSRKNPITIQVGSGSDSIRTTSLVSSFTLSADGGAVVLINTATREWWQM